jgi:nicotinamide-nucleotide amidase
MTARFPNMYSMRAEILSIGTELLLGQITDTNAVYLSQRLAGLGIGCYYRDTVGDNMTRLQEVIRLAKSRSDLLIATGGLGPTEDDITAEAVSAVFEAPLVLNPEAAAHIESFFARRGRPVTANQLKQAHIPEGAVMLPNPVGTAPGFLLDKDGVVIIVMPGPPQEMLPMWEGHVAPLLRERSGAVIVSRTLRFCGIGEGALEMEIKDLIDAQTDVTIAPYAKLAEVHIRLTARAADEAAAQARIAPVEAAVRASVGRFIYGVDEETLEEVVGRGLRGRRLTLAVAESCTGGMLGGRITNVAGASDYFLGGVIAYSNALKERLLGVPRETLAAHGAVSEETAVAMAEGLVRATGADLGVSITGIAGPGGGTTEKPVGLVYIGIAGAGQPRAHRCLFLGDRSTIRLRAAQEALVLLREVLTYTEALG